MRRRATVVAAVLALAASVPVPSTGSPEAPRPQRIVALAPNVVELLFALDLGDRVIGVGDHSRWPTAVEELPQLGGLVDPHLERIVALDPDLAVLLPSQQELAGELGRLGIDVLVVDSETIDDVAAAAVKIARRCGVGDRGAAFVDRWRRALAPRPVPGSPRVLVVIGRRPGDLSQVLVAGPESFHAELVRRAGGVNVFDDVALPYPQVSLEAILSRDPDLIIELHVSPLDADTERRIAADWTRLDGLDAGGDGVAVIDADYALVPGPRMPRLYDDIRAAMAER